MLKILTIVTRMIRLARYKFILHIATEQRQFACVGPGKDKPCPDNWAGVSKSGNAKRCDNCTVAYNRLNRNFHKRKRNARKRVLTSLAS